MRRPKNSFNNGFKAKSTRIAIHENQTTFWGRIGVTQSRGSRYENGDKLPEPVQLLLELTYGSDAKAEKLLEYQRGWNQK